MSDDVRWLRQFEDKTIAVMRKSKPPRPEP
jgi:hypothetical protein